MTQSRALAALELPSVATGLGTLRAPAAVRVVATHAFSDRLLQLTLVRMDKRPIRFEPGHFCKIAVPSSQGEVWRSYSVATPAESGRPVETFDIAVAGVNGGVATNYLFTRRVGDSLRTAGPFGRLLLPKEDPEHYLLIGTGTGMAPYRAMLPELEARAAVRPLFITMLMGARNRAECLYGSEFLQFARGDPARRRFLVRYSREAPDVATGFESHGYVQDALPALALAPTKTRVFLCGNPKMIDTTTEMLVERGFDRRALVREKYLLRPLRA